MNFQLVVAIVKSEMTDKVIEAGKKAGAPGATILPAQGTGISEAKTFFGMDLDIASDVILFLLEESMVDNVIDSIHAIASFDTPGTGISFAFPVSKVKGLQGQMKQFYQNNWKVMHKDCGKK